MTDASRAEQAYDLLESGRLTEALALANPQDPDCFAVRLYCLGLLGRLREAALMVEDEGARSHESAGVAAWIAEILGRQQLSDSFRLLERPDSSDEVLSIRQIQSRDSAVAAWEAARRLDIAPTRYTSRLYLLWLAAEAGASDDTKRLLAGFDTDDESLLVYMLRTRFAAESGDHEASLRAATTLSERFPEVADSFYYLGIVLEIRKEFGQALEAYRKGHALAPNHPLLNKRLAFRYLRGLQPRQALAHAEVASAVFPHDRDLPYYVFVSHLMAGKWRQAFKDLAIRQGRAA